MTKNPWNTERTPGGSSGGEGSLIGGGGSPFGILNNVKNFTIKKVTPLFGLGIGSDIGGSARFPAAFCGIYSIKYQSFRMRCGILYR